MIELRPLDVYFDLNQEEILRNYTCSYKASEPLGEIAFYTDSIPVMSSSVIAMNSSVIDVNSSVIAVNSSEPQSAALTAVTFHENYSSSNSLSQTIRITKGTKYVRCKVFDRDTIERGSMASRVHYLSNNRLSTLKRGFMLGTEFYTMNGLPLLGSDPGFTGVLEISISQPHYVAEVGAYHRITLPRSTRSKF
ncbi:hypothetical protein Avbf_12936 [Armadillidium vulgare]|nr:hypothetical protein Avbf_12936 [Armadillidium vulgare]